MRKKGGADRLFFSAFHRFFAVKQKNSEKSGRIGQDSEKTAVKWRIA